MPAYIADPLTPFADIPAPKAVLGVGAGQGRHQSSRQRNINYREHWIRRIIFAAETNAAVTHTAWQRDAQYLRSLSGGEGNDVS